MKQLVKKGLKNPNRIVPYIENRVNLWAKMALSRVKEPSLSQIEHKYQIMDKDNLSKRRAYEIDQETILIRGLATQYLEPNNQILEVGCNVGRNLECLRRGGFTNLTGVDINKSAIEVMEKKHPTLYKQASTQVGAAHKVLSKFEPSSFELIFTNAVLIHIHSNFDRILDEMARTSKSYILTSELESELPNKEPVEQPGIVKLRNYKREFEKRGFVEREHIQTWNIESYKGVDTSSLNGKTGYTLRLFEKEEIEDRRF